jgi:hypothetical protein
MKPAELRAWIERNGLSHERAAWQLALTRNVLRKYLYGASRISPQTALLVELLDEKGGSQEKGGIGKARPGKARRGEAWGRMAN